MGRRKKENNSKEKIIIVKRPRKTTLKKIDTTKSLIKDGYVFLKEKGTKLIFVKDTKRKSIDR